jgi:hypothetical protein
MLHNSRQSGDSAPAGVIARPSSVRDSGDRSFIQAVVFRKPILERERERTEIAIKPQCIYGFQIRYQPVHGRQQLKTT